MPAATAPSSVPGSQSPATLPAERDAFHLEPPDLERLVEQASGQSSRAEARIIAEADPLEKVARDTLRPLGEGRWTMKCVIDEECQEGLRLLTDLLAHVDPALSWGDLVGRLVQEGLRRHDPRLGGRRRAAAAAQQSAASPLGSTHASAPALRPPTAPTSAPKPAAAHPSDTAGEAAAQVTDAATPADGSAAAGHPADTSTPGNGAAPTPAALTSAAKPAAVAPPHGRRAPPPKPAPAAPTSAPKSASVAPPAAAQPSPVAGAAPVSPPPAAPARARSTPIPPRPTPARAIPAAVKRLVWVRDQARCRYVDPVNGRRCASRHLLQIDHIQPLACGGGAEPSNLRLPAPPRCAPSARPAPAAGRAATRGASQSGTALITGPRGG